MAKFKIPFQDKLAFGYSLARTLHFTSQQLALPIFELFSTGKSKKLLVSEPLRVKTAFREIFRLLRKDAENISNGIYPPQVLLPEAPKEHLLRFPKIIFDGYRLSKRRENKNAHDFPPEAQDFLKGLPEYYQRNFHFQTGGYLTKESADLYEHQVEILFSGAADAMRRLIIPLMKNVHPGDGEGLNFLEVAAGTGRLTRFMRLAYPKAKITVLDLSYPYLKKAQENLKDFERLDFVQGAAEALPFQDAQFDFTYSCFLYLELPLEIRRRVVGEAYRVLKPEGYFGFVDSVQKDDTVEFKWALEQFPLDFHEPFYKNYTLNPMEGLMSFQGFTPAGKDQGFFAKALLGRKPIST